MFLEKQGQITEQTNPTHIVAYKENGWVEISTPTKPEEPKPKPAKKKK